ncbi:MAG TPA: diguanylate cyclase [Stellaceae bacterium]|nr:diguanylate cyclase [Stellaceae bacterium]
MTAPSFFKFGLTGAERQTVLIVDDSPLIMAMLTATLGDDCTILSARNGQEAIDLIAERVPDLILLDIVMPRVSGFEVCQRLKADPRTQSTPVIFITGLDAKEDEMRALELGAIDFIPKPVDVRVLTLRVRNHLELKRYRDFLENLSLVDGLTGIGNRRRFDETLAREWGRAKRLGKPMSLILIDVDHFKNFNDLYGHQLGDDCLRQVAHVLSGTLHRPSDLIARFGGEEFAAILPDTDAEGTRFVAERMLENVAKLGMPHAASSVAPHITVSIGCAASIPDDTNTPAGLVKFADECLYDAKRAGRNRII